MRSFVSDFTTKEVPFGGSEWVNKVIVDRYGLPFIYSSNMRSIDIDSRYMISNISLMKPELIKEIHKIRDYIIIEHDYKICASRHPWRWQDSIIPINERINYEIYENARAVFVQTNDHLKVYKQNGVKGNFINLHTSIWSDEDLNMLESIYEHYEKNGRSKCNAIYDSGNWIKNKDGNIKYCVGNGLDYKLVGNKPTRYEFLFELAGNDSLVFFPIARETMCRLVVEAKCMGMEVITSDNYGASKEAWFQTLSGKELIEHLRRQTNINLRKIETYL